MQITNTQGNVLSVEFIGDKDITEEVKKLCGSVDQLSKKQSHICMVMLLEHLQEENAIKVAEALRDKYKGTQVLFKVALLGDHDPAIAETSQAGKLSWQEKYFEIENLNAAWRWINESAN